MIKNYKTGGVSSFSQILLEGSFESLCEALASAIACQHKVVISQFGNIMEDQWKFVNAHGRDQANAWLNEINAELAGSEEQKVSLVTKQSKPKQKASLLPHSLLLKMSKKIPIHPQLVMDRLSRYRTQDGNSLLHLAVQSNSTEAVDMLISNGFQMYQAKTPGPLKQAQLDDYSDTDEDKHQFVTPLDSLLRYDSVVAQSNHMLEHLVKNWQFDVSRECIFHDGTAGPSFQNCLCERIKQAKCQGEWHLIMNRLIGLVDKFSNTDLYRSIEVLRAKNKERAQNQRRCKGHHAECQCTDCLSYFEFFRVKQYYDDYPDKLMQRAIRQQLYLKSVSRSSSRENRAFPAQEAISPERYESPKRLRNGQRKIVGKERNPAMSNSSSVRSSQKFRLSVNYL